jgi:hypothetical protein
MSAGKIIYVVIAKDRNTILSEFSEHSGNFQQNTLKILSKVVPNHNATINYQEYKFHYLDISGLTILSMSNKEFSDEVIYCFLEDTLNKFKDTFTSLEISNATAFSLNNVFVQALKHNMYYYNTNPKCDDALSKLKSAVIEFRKNVFKADELLNERGEKLVEINVKAESLKTESETYYKKAKKVRTWTRWKKIALIAFIIFVVLLVGYIISAIVCGFDYSKCSKRDDNNSDNTSISSPFPRVQKSSNYNYDSPSEISFLTDKVTKTATYELLIKNE